MDGITEEVRLQEWGAAIAECNNSGMTKKEWCRQNGMSLKTFYYRQMRVRQAAYQRMTSVTREEKGIQFSSSFRFHFIFLIRTYSLLSDVSLLVNH